MKITLVIIALVAVIAAVVLIRACGGDDTGTLPSDESTTELRLPTTIPAGDSTAALPGADGRLVDVGGHRLFVRSFGAGSPTVVIEPGIGDAGRVWGAVIDRLDDETQVVLYARAGYERSDPGPMPRSADRIVRELNRLLVNTSVESPYVIVGHSLGAIHALLYASEHPHAVAGVVLLDPPPLGFIEGQRFPDLYQMAEDMTAGFRRDAERARSSGDERQAAMFEAIASEHEQMFESGWSWVKSVSSLGAIPLVVVASGVPNPQFGTSAEDFQVYWRESSEKLSQLSTRGRFVFVKESTHDLPGDAPDVVIEAITWCIDQSDESQYESWQDDK